MLRSEGFHVNENSTDTSWESTSVLPICSAAPLPLSYHSPHTNNRPSDIPVQMLKNEIEILKDSFFNPLTPNDHYSGRTHR